MLLHEICSVQYRTSRNHEVVYLAIRTSKETFAPHVHELITAERTLYSMNSHFGISLYWHAICSECTISTLKKSEKDSADLSLDNTFVVRSEACRYYGPLPP
jgi:hypothetical protein